MSKPDPITITAVASSRIVEGGRAGGVRYSDYTRATVELSWDPDFVVEVDMTADGEVREWDRRRIPEWMWSAIEQIAVLVDRDDREVHTFLVEPVGARSAVTIQVDDAA